MGWEPTTACRLCGEPFDTYMAYEDRFCGCDDGYAPLPGSGAYQPAREIRQPRQREWPATRMGGIVFLVSAALCVLAVIAVQVLKP